MSFKRKKYLVIKKAISKELANFIYHYFNLKRNTTAYLLNKRLISPFEESWGTFKDTQVPGTFSCFSDLVMETLLAGLKLKIEKATKFKLIETYSYARIYKNGDILKRHKDRQSCAVSATLSLGGDRVWPIYLEPSGKTNQKGIAVKLNPGDMMLYSGCDVEHWREPYEGKDCGQVFLHYNSKNDPNKIPYDGRPAIGLPEFAKYYK